MRITIPTEVQPERITGGATPDAWVQNGSIYATNGKAAVRLPLGVDTADVVHVTDDQLKMIRKAGGSVDVESNRLLVNGANLWRVTATPTPNVDSVIPEEGRGKVAVGINVRLLLDLAMAMGADVVQLEIESDTTPIRVTPIFGKVRKVGAPTPAPIPGAVGAIMPVAIY